MLSQQVGGWVHVLIALIKFDPFNQRRRMLVQQWQA
jgi:hypothetical protein